MNSPARETLKREEYIFSLGNIYFLPTKLTLKDVVWSQADRMDIAVKTAGLCLALGEERNANAMLGTPAFSCFLQS